MRETQLQLHKATSNKSNNKLTYAEIDLDYQEPLAICAYGPAGSGKTRLGISLPGRIGVVPLNRKTMQTATQVAKELGKTLYKPEFDLVRSSNPMKAMTLKPSCGKTVYVRIEEEQPWCCAQHNGRWAVDRTKQAALDLYAMEKVDSILLDGFDIFCEDMLTAHYGRIERIQPRDRGPYNKEMIEFLGALAGKHFMLTTGWKELWKNEKPTGKYDWAGWTHLNYHVGTICEMKLRDDYDASKHDWKFSLTMVACQANSDLIGVAGENLLTDAAISVPLLAQYIYPDSEPERWE